jgi:hypothetical protein
MNNKNNYSRQERAAFNKRVFELNKRLRALPIYLRKHIKREKLIKDYLKSLSDLIDGIDNSRVQRRLRNYMEMQILHSLMESTLNYHVLGNNKLSDVVAKMKEDLKKNGKRNKKKTR